jgi:DNA-binding MarR family transcriptional regulator
MTDTCSLTQDCDHIAATCALFATRRLARSLSRLFDSELAITGLRGTQYNVLVAIARRRGTNLTQLGAMLGMDRTTLTHALRPLQKARLVRSTTGQDRRARGIALTALGRRRVQAGVARWRAAQSAVEAAAGSAGWTEINSQLRRLNRSIVALT